MNKPELAARFFFKNGAVSITTDGEMIFSPDIEPTADDIQLNREFTPLTTWEDFAEGNDFFTFLNESSESTASIIKKLSAIGYILCNKLDRSLEKKRYRAFMCVNEEEGAKCNGKTLFTEAIAALCVADKLCDANLKNPFALSGVTDATQVVIVDGLPGGVKVQQFFNLVTSDWIVNRKCEPTKTVPFNKAPHLVLISDAVASKIRRDNSFRRRFTVLEFSSYWNQENRVCDHFGHEFFDGWDAEQWNKFDNFMFYCVREYVQTYSNGQDIFGFYS